MIPRTHTDYQDVFQVNKFMVVKVPGNGGGKGAIDLDLHKYTPCILKSQYTELCHQYCGNVLMW